MNRPRVLVTREVFQETLDYLAKVLCARGVMAIDTHRVRDASAADFTWTLILATVRCTHRRGGIPRVPTP